jgi:hypothetical protein
MGQGTATHKDWNLEICVLNGLQPLHLSTSARLHGFYLCLMHPVMVAVRVLAYAMLEYPNSFCQGECMSKNLTNQPH